MVLINSALLDRELISLCTAVQILSNSTSVTLVFVLKVLLVFPLQHLLHFHWIYFKLACNCGKTRVVSRNCRHGVYKKRLLTSVSSDTDVVLVWLRSLRDWISRVSRFEPVQNRSYIVRTVLLSPPMLILCGDYRVWSSLCPSLQVLPLVHIQSISLRAKVVAVATQRISKLRPSLTKPSYPWRGLSGFHSC